MNILAAIKDENLFRPFLGDDLTSWKPWATALRALYRLPFKTDEQRGLLRQCTGRDANELPPGPFRTALFLTGRRSGKSRIASVIGAYEALFGGHEQRLAKGESGVVAIISPSKFQSTVIWKYLQGIFETPLLAQEVVNVQESTNNRSMELRNRLQIRVLVGDWRTVRGPSLVAALVDEVCFFGLNEESKVRSDHELVRALRPGLATTNGKLIAISSKYSRKGWAYSTWTKQHGSNRETSPAFVSNWTTLVWDAPSRVMNSTLDQAEIDAAYAEDPAAARSEFGGEWRDDVSAYIDRSLVDTLVVKGRKELLPRPEHSYFAFADASGGRHDDAALAIGHREENKVILDFCKRWMAPFSPDQIIAQQAVELKRFGLTRVTCDNYAAEFVTSAFRSQGIIAKKAELPKSKLYKEMLPVLCSGTIELLDDSKLVDQISSLERRTRSGGDDVIDHPPGAKDDMANVVAGVAAGTGKGPKTVGGMWRVEGQAVGVF